MTLFVALLALSSPSAPLQRGSGVEQLVAAFSHVPSKEPFVARFLSRDASVRDIVVESVARRKGQPVWSMLVTLRNGHLAVVTQIKGAFPKLPVKAFRGAAEAMSRETGALPFPCEISWHNWGQRVTVDFVRLPHTPGAFTSVSVDDNGEHPTFIHGE